MEPQDIPAVIDRVEILSFKNGPEGVDVSSEHTSRKLQRGIEILPARGIEIVVDRIVMIWLETMPLSWFGSWNCRNANELKKDWDAGLKV